MVLWGAPALIFLWQIFLIVVSFFVLDERYVYSLFNKYILLEDKRTYSKVDLLFLIRKMYESGYHTLAFFCLHTFEAVNPPGTFHKFLLLFPNIFDNCNKFWWLSNKSSWKERTPLHIRKEALYERYKEARMIWEI